MFEATLLFKIDLVEDEVPVSKCPVLLPCIHKNHMQECTMLIGFSKLRIVGSCSDKIIVKSFSVAKA